MTIEEMKMKKRRFGYTNIQLAKLSGIPLGTLQKIFTGETKNPRYETLKALEKVLSGEPEPYWHPEQNTRFAVKEAPAEYALNPEKKQGEYTVEDYESIPDQYRTELIDGVIYDMASPSRFHQMAAGEIYRQIANFIIERGGDCIPGIAPIDVQLDQDDRTMVQPDVIIVCRPEMYNEKNVFGAPDFVLEILSPGTRRKDVYVKLNKYREAGVKEYWIADPVHRNITVHLFDEDDSPWVYPLDGDVPVGIYKGELIINLTRIMKWLPDNTEKKPDFFHSGFFERIENGRH